MCHASHQRLADLIRLLMFDGAYADRLVVDADDHRVVGQLRSTLLPHKVQQQYVYPGVFEQLYLIVNL